MFGVALWWRICSRFYQQKCGGGRVLLIQGFSDGMEWDEVLKWWYRSSDLREIYDIYEYFVHAKHHPYRGKGEEPEPTFGDYDPNIISNPHFRYSFDLHDDKHRVSLRTTRILIYHGHEGPVLHSIWEGQQTIPPEDNVPIRKIQLGMRKCDTVQASWYNSSDIVLSAAIKNRRELLAKDFYEKLSFMEKIDARLWEEDSVSITGY